MTYRKFTGAARAARLSAVLFALAVGGCASDGASLGERVQQPEIQGIDGAYNPCPAGSLHANSAFENHSQCLAVHRRVLQLADLRFARNEV